MLRISLATILCLTSPPVPPGVTSVHVSEVQASVKVLDACLQNVTADAVITVEVLDQADGDDQQPYRFSVETHAHEDIVACLVTAVGGKS